MILVFTICSNNYLAQAIVLGNTLKKHNPSYRFVIGLVDKKLNSFDYSSVPHEIIEVENIGVPWFDEMVMRYNIVELNTAFKPFYFSYFFQTTDAASVIYLDPDIEVFSQFTVLENELETNNIVVTPHFMTPLNDDKWQAEEDFLNAGIYNLGFIAIRNNNVGKEMVGWWSERLRNKAFINYSKGMFTDQIWINFVPLFFEGVKILTHKGHNVAYWNLHERVISSVGGRYMINNDTPLVFYHYASFRPLNPGMISSGQRRFTFESRPDILPLFTNYCEVLFANNYKTLVEHPCYYVDLKERREEESLREKIRQVPLWKKGMGKIVRIIIKRFNLIMDYNTLR